MIMKCFFPLVAMALSFVPPVTYAEDAALLKSEFIFDPNPVPSCHASTIVETARRTLVSAWFAGTKEGANDVGIWLSRQVDGKWAPPHEVCNGVRPNGKRFACYNPVLFQPKEGPLLLFYKVGGAPEGWTGFLKTSTDDGVSWSEAKELPEGFVGPVKNKPVQLANGTLLGGASIEYRNGLNVYWRVQFESTPDLGKTWTKTPFLNDGLEISAIQPSILFLGEEHLLAIGRTRQKRLFEIESSDLGKNWGTMRLTELPNPNSGTDAVTLKDGRHLLIYNHSEKGRSPLNLAVSADGKAWSAALVLEDEKKAEFSYPAIIQTSDGLVHATYTWKRKLIKHAVIDPGRLTLKPMVKGEWPK